MAQSSFRENAQNARAEADAATLDNVRDRCLRAEAAWLAMADRQDRVEKARNINRSGEEPPATGNDNIEQDIPGQVAR